MSVSWNEMREERKGGERREEKGGRKEWRVGEEGEEGEE